MSDAVQSNVSMDSSCFIRRQRDNGDLLGDYLRTVVESDRGSLGTELQICIIVTDLCRLVFDRQRIYYRQIQIPSQ